MQANRMLADLETRLWAHEDDNEVAKAVARDLTKIEKLIDKSTPPL
jgi:hypothetical protein